MSHHPANADRITVARLHAAAGRMVETNADDYTAVAALQTIATERSGLRVDLLSDAAGTHLGACLLAGGGGTNEEVGRRVAAPSPGLARRLGAP